MSEDAPGAIGTTSFKARLGQAWAMAWGVWSAATNIQPNNSNSRNIMCLLKVRLHQI
jgi:hypothetical protein